MRISLVFAVLLCAPAVFAADMVETKIKLPLHEHPTLLKMLSKNNDLRKSQGLQAHRISPELTMAAQDHARYMAGTGAFDHDVNGSPFSRASKHGYRGQVRENIAYGYRNVASAFGGWSNSSGHWASIVSDTSEVGFGYAIAEDGTQYWVGVYGYPSSEAR